MKTNELKKGARFRLRNGWEATMRDNARGNIRMAEVEGMYTEIGSVYAHDIFSAVDDVGAWQFVQHTPAQIKLRVTVERMLGPSTGAQAAWSVR